MKAIPTLLLLITIALTSYSQDEAYVTLKDIPYYEGSKKQQDKYIRERCLLDITYPNNKTDFATVVWIHGGGLTGLPLRTLCRRLPGTHDEGCRSQAVPTA